MSEAYIRNHFDKIKQYACVVEQRLDDTCCTMESVLEDNAHYLELCKRHQTDYVLIEDEYKIELPN